jgi:hypothetical protein
MNNLAMMLPPLWVQLTKVGLTFGLATLFAYLSATVRPGERFSTRDWFRALLAGLALILFLVGIVFISVLMRFKAFYFEGS